ncbi:MAG: P-II family nitrogen regulator [Clostridium sp.]|uniref:P-II family nitrogen regulator n=1 Tax=Clostridium sp. TaxID=1506 RepID=UPI003D6C78C5
MKLLFFILNRPEKLDDVLTEFTRRNISGATVVDSMGMARLLSHEHDEGEIAFLGSLRSFLNPEREKSKLIFTVIHEWQLEEAVNAIESVVGDLSLKDTGVVFSVPIDFTKGIRKIGK